MNLIGTIGPDCCPLSAHDLVMKTLLPAVAASSTREAELSPWAQRQLASAPPLTERQHSLFSAVFNSTPLLRGVREAA
jgi:hypothetical protein